MFTQYIQLMYPGTSTIYTKEWILMAIMVISESFSDTMRKAYLHPYIKPFNRGCPGDAQCLGRFLGRTRHEGKCSLSDQPINGGRGIGPFIFLVVFWKAYTSKVQDSLTLEIVGVNRNAEENTHQRSGVDRIGRPHKDLSQVI